MAKTSTADQEKTYVVKSDGFLLGTWYNHNSHVQMTEGQAEIFLREGRVELVEPRTAAPRADTAAPRSDAKTERRD